MVIKAAKDFGLGIDYSISSNLTKPFYIDSVLVGKSEEEKNKIKLTMI